MKHMLEELMKKKGKGEKLDPQYKDAKMSVLEEIKGLCENRMKDDLGGLKKVTVAAPDSEALKEGLSKAEDMVDKMPEMASEESEEEESEMTDEEKAMLEKLLKKAKMA